MDSDPEDAVGNEEITGATSTAQVPESSLAGASTGTSRNAFDLLMAAKPKTLVPFKGPFIGKDELGAYTAHPSPRSKWPGVVIHADAHSVFIHDKFPKSTIHTLLLPRSPLSRSHPFDAFNDADFLASVKEATAELKRWAAEELRRLYGPYSEQERPRQSVLNGEVEWDPDVPMPAGRDWEKELLVGVHAKPSMNDLHVHVMSRDMMGPRMLKSKHYLSFNTKFLVDIDDFPLPEDDPRRMSDHRRKYLKEDLVCWRCKKNFGNDFAALKKHLEVEFEAWKRV